MSLIAQAAGFRAALASVEVEMLSGDSCFALAEALAVTEKSCAAVRAMAAARAAACGSHRGSGHREPDDWLATLTGGTRRAARAELETGARLADCPETREAATAGELSLGQAEVITKTEADKPGSEGDLVAKAKRSSRQELADACRKRRQEGVDRDELASRQRKARSLRSWTDGDGMICGQFRLEPLHGVPLLERIRVEADRLRRASRAEGSAEPWDAHAADALVGLLAAEADGAVDAGGAVGRARRTPARRRADVVLVVDLCTYRTGEHDATVCHIVGGGPVPPDVVREMAKDAFLKVVFHDGVNIHTVSHPGRYIPAELRTALDLGGPPDFDGTRCSGCGNKFRLEWDHVEPVCAGGITSFENEDAKCWACHQAKSDAERAAGLYGTKVRGPTAAQGP